MSLNTLASNPLTNKSANTTTDIYTDLNGLQNLKQSAVKDSQAALPEAARQFEAVMITMMLKNLRKTGMEDAIFKSQAEDSYRDMYDQQLGLELSKGRGIGVARAIISQLDAQQSGQHRLATGDETPAVLKMPQRRGFADYYSTLSHTTIQGQSTDLQTQVETASIESTAKHSNINNSASSIQFESPKHFVEKLWPLAEKAAEKLGVSAEVILSQSALETGWGKHILYEGEQSSRNLFNIKAHHGWNGKQMEKSSIEFLQGKAVQQKSAFRVYDSLQQSFDDYVSYLQTNPRYQKVLDKASYAEQKLHDSSYIKALHKAGYATDPSYSDKVLNVLNSEVIQNQLKLALKE